MHSRQSNQSISRFWSVNASQTNHAKAVFEVDLCPVHPSRCIIGSLRDELHIRAGGSPGRTAAASGSQESSGGVGGRDRFPRIRGDRPNMRSAGAVTFRFPRTRRDRPGIAFRKGDYCAVPPHPRRWTCRIQRASTSTKGSSTLARKDTISAMRRVRRLIFEYSESREGTANQSKPRDPPRGPSRHYLRLHHVPRPGEETSRGGGLIWPCSEPMLLLT